MYEFLSGKLIEVDTLRAVIDVGGVGYSLAAPAPALSEWRLRVGQKTLIYVRLHVSENDQRLFGFRNKQERELFVLFQSVSGVGPMLALSLVGASSQTRVVEAIANGDPSPLLVVKGVGKKTAERICVELKDRIQKGTFAVPHQAKDLAGDLIAALMSLGFHRTEAQQTATLALEANPGAKDVEVLIRLALSQGHEASE